MKRMWLLLFFSAMYLSGRGQNALTGMVSGAKGDKLVGANVVIEHTFQGTVTGPDGVYSFKKLKEGSCTVTVSYMGYARQSREVTIPVLKPVDFVLQPSDILTDEVVVKGTRTAGKSPAALTVVDKEEINRSNMGQDMPFLLSMVPSLVATSDAGTGIGYTNLRIRGSDSYRINVTVNGIPLNDAESQGVWWIDLPDIASSTDNIHVQRGVGASTNGAGAFGATISLQTNILNKDPYCTVNLGAGSFNTRRTNVMIGSGLINNRFSFDARLSKINSDGYIDRAYSHLSSFFLSGAWYGEKKILRLNVFSGTEHTFQAWYGVEKSILDTNRRWNPYTYDNETDNYRQTHYQLIYSQELSSSLYLSAALHCTPGKGYYEQYEKDKNMADYNIPPLIFGLDTIDHTDLIQQKWMDNDFYGTVFSLNYRSRAFDAVIGGGGNHYYGYHYGKVIWAQYAGDTPIRHEWYRNKGIKDDYNIYLKTSYHLLRNLDAFADIQYRFVNYTIKGIDDYRDFNGLPVDVGQEHRYNFLNPKLGVFYTFSTGKELYCTFSTGQKEPTRSNYLDATLSTVKPKSELLFDYEAGVNLSGLSWKANVNLFYMDYRDQLVSTGRLNDVAYPVMTNVPSSYRAGVELSVACRLGSKLMWEGNAAFSRNKIRNFTEYADYYDADYNYLGNFPKSLGETDISYSPSVTAASSLKYQFLVSGSACLMSRYVESQYFDNTSSTDRRLDSYFINDLTLEYTLHPRYTKGVTLRLLINNLFNVMYENNAYGGNWYENNVEKTWAYYFPQAGINFLAGVSLNF